MTDEKIAACYRFAGGFLIGIFIGISWVDFHNAKAQLPEAGLPILLIGLFVGVCLGILPKFIREGFWLSIFPSMMPFRLFLLIMIVVPLILICIPHRKGGVIEHILANHWWNWL